MRLIVFLFFICAGNTFAGALYCGGKVEKLGLHASDQIMLKLSSMNQAVFICSPNKKWTVVGQAIQPVLKCVALFCPC